ncbi:cell filamentation protein Fic [Polynucleobacter paneuropaeus]|uniref:protein adenylyltransferase n=1 Tax=Polynucleobacter paneuropaeus TaxID=2527775 RepID=A0ABX9FCH0_9BURK|nr:Fic family protein [Polynucleobacter paneuropaeus]AWW47540.1 cell filamentation protein Fic [Polynucleobacter paneuropaeus]MBT8556350.1 cell filamentation protein Fic [Polynucleobacter paneuropaeus]MBT8585582.1 cell filamentation protein Fic [Polynucleobacter paneuropaeus]MBT8593907.1 cell filamentation protein Fic [Polynucleobacter paneuropaeus]MBT8606755.1 cell filamentation protein Fic [Polynucleobacter paneuropaeus]
MSRYDADDTYCYPGTDVLRNKAEITNAEDLDAYEGELSTLRSIEILENPIAGQFDLAHLQRIHLALFQDVYEWAGKIRTVDISRGNSRFANVRFIESAASDIFNKLARENWLRGLDADTLSKRLAHYLSEINALHPFREGNGRVQRIFISQLSQSAGYQLDYSDLEQEQIYRAMELAFNGDELILAELILEHLEISE